MEEEDEERDDTNYGRGHDPASKGGSGDFDPSDGGVRSNTLEEELEGAQRVNAWVIALTPTGGHMLLQKHLTWNWLYPGGKVERTDQGAEASLTLTNSAATNR